MKCDGCNTTIKSGEAHEHLGRTLCEDCYMDALSPVRTCDPWAVHSAKSLEKFSGGEVTLTPVQSQVLDILKETGGIEPSDLLGRLNNRMTMEELRREFSALRHMEKARAEKQGDRIFWRVW